MPTKSRFSKPKREDRFRSMTQNRRQTPKSAEETSKRLLIIDDEENMRHMLTVLLRRIGYVADTAVDGREGLEMLDRQDYDFILCDVKMPRMDGMAFLRAAEDRLEGTTVIMMSAYGNIDTAIEAMKLGAYDYIAKPFKTDEVHLTLRKAEERERLKQENSRLKEQIRKIESEHTFSNMVGRSKVMRDVFALAEKVARYNTTVLIRGESGTGKELVARAIHFNGIRHKKALIPVNCGGIPENLLESEFFGYRKGAFTGAEKDRKGLFEEASGGTLFLDEVSELPLTLQVKLLRVLQENEIRPVGDSRTRKIDVRVIAATSRDLAEEVAAGNFRQDLFYRLNVLTINLPPLRDRTEDIPLLCRHFIDRFNTTLGKEIQDISPDAMKRLLQHRWPGNVRELENVIERAMVLTDKTVLDEESLPPECLSAAGTDAQDPFEGYSLKEAQRILERRLIAKALEKTGGNRTQAGRLLEISHPSLLSKIKTYKIKG